MRHRALFLLPPLFLAACAGGPAQAPESSGAPAANRATQMEQQTQAAGAAATAYASFSKRRAMRHVRRLAGEIGVRVRTTQAETRAAEYIAARFQALGYEVHVQEFEVDGATSRNVVAWWPGAQRYGFVVGGHMDTVAGSPGANDNASGIGVILEAARIFAGTEPAHHVRFVAFGAEEYGRDGSHHVGSAVYVRRLGSEGRARLGGMLSVDMVADGRPLLIGNSGIAEDAVARTVYRIVRAAGVAAAYRTTCDCSDNGPFERAGIPASFFWSGSEPDYHDASDTVANMSPADLYRSGKALRAFLKEVDAEMIRRFRRAG